MYTVGVLGYMGPHSQSWKLRHVVSNPLYIGGRLKLFGFKLMSLFSSGTCFRALTALCFRCGAKFTWMLKEKESYRLGFTGRLWVVLQDCAKGILSIGHILCCAYLQYGSIQFGDECFWSLHLRNSQKGWIARGLGLSPCGLGSTPTSYSP